MDGIGKRDWNGSLEYYLDFSDILSAAKERMCSCRCEKFVGPSGDEMMLPTASTHWSRIGGTESSGNQMIQSMPALG
jgi:hypothetical protein